MRQIEEIVPDLLPIGIRRHATYLGSHAIDMPVRCRHDLLIVRERARAKEGA